MGAATLVSVEDYLSTSYSPDREYLDGRIVERNLGELTHGRIQRRLIVYFHLRSKELGIEVVPEQRVQVGPTRFRIPDVTIVKTSQIQGEIFTAPPHLCIEILSKDDTLDYMQEKIDDYLQFGVPYVWIINPRLRKGYVATKAGMVEAESGILETADPDIRVPIAELFDVD
ncbi:MAG: Uma2 family endonuclease [Bryobacteraceae bacterium]|jgi:Uma2 family endonuclease